MNDKEKTILCISCGVEVKPNDNYAYWIEDVDLCTVCARGGTGINEETIIDNWEIAHNPNECAR